MVAYRIQRVTNITQPFIKSTHKKDGRNHRWAHKKVQYAEEKKWGPDWFWYFAATVLGLGALVSGGVAIYKQVAANKSGNRERSHKMSKKMGRKSKERSKVERRV